LRLVISCWGYSSTFLEVNLVDALIVVVPYDRLPSSSEDEAGDGGEESENEFNKLDDRELDARSRAQVLEMVGDIGHADMKPPENVLFVCKLNPLTDENGLHIIFSRFGPCKVNIIKDASTGESLCYGFVEFEQKHMCERAYFKMENALIDDRFIITVQSHPDE